MKNNLPFLWHDAHPASIPPDPTAEGTSVLQLKLEGCHCSLHHPEVSLAGV